MVNSPLISSKVINHPMIEFFNHHSGLTPEADMVKKDSRYYTLSDMLTEAEAQRIIMLLLDNKKSREIVMKMRENNITGTIAVVRRFKACNWDRLDHIPDISDDGQLNFEYVDCGYKGFNKRCPYSQPGDTKPYCIVKNLFNIPTYAENTTDRKHLA
jgi:hypothetical protein